MQLFTSIRNQLLSQPVQSELRGFCTKPTLWWFWIRCILDCKLASTHAIPKVYQNTIVYWKSRKFRWGPIHCCNTGMYEIHQHYTIVRFIPSDPPVAWGPLRGNLFDIEFTMKCYPMFSDIFCFVLSVSTLTEFVKPYLENPHTKFYLCTFFGLF